MWRLRAYSRPITAVIAAAAFALGGYEIGRSTADRAPAPTGVSWVQPQPVSPTAAVEGTVRVVDDQLHVAARTLAEITGIESPRAVDGTVLNALAACLEELTSTVARAKLPCGGAAEPERPPSRLAAYAFRPIELDGERADTLAAQLSALEWRRLRAAIDAWNAEVTRAGSVAALRERRPVIVVRLQLNLLRARMVLQPLAEE